MHRSKTCFKCKETKPLEAFYKHSQMADGRLNKCIECAKQDVLIHRANNLEKIREYDRQRSKQGSRIQSQIEYTRLWRAEDRRRSKAHSAVARAIKSGMLERQPCEQCNSKKTVGHHDDYDKPLQVRWLCQPCHVKHHNQTKEP